MSLLIDIDAEVTGIEGQDVVKGFAAQAQRFYINKRKAQTNISKQKTRIKNLVQSCTTKLRLNDKSWEEERESLVQKIRTLDRLVIDEKDRIKEYDNFLYAGFMHLSFWYQTGKARIVTDYDLPGTISAAEKEEASPESTKGKIPAKKKPVTKMAAAMKTKAVKKKVETKKKMIGKTKKTK